MATNPMPSPAAKPRHTPLRLLYIGTALLILVLLATNAAVILHFRESELLTEENHQKNLSLILAEQAERSFQPVDLVISSVADRIAAEGVTDSATFDQKLAGRDINLLLREKLIGVPQLDALTVINSDGRLINFSRPWPVPLAEVTDRDYFKAMKENPNLKSYISAPVQNHVTGTWIIFLAHRVSGANAEFLGIILGAIELRYFEDFYRTISLDEGTSVALMRLDGTTLMRFPRNDTIGKIVSNSQRLLHGHVSATLREPSPIDGLMRLKAVRLVANYPVLTIATITEEAALSDWRAIAQLMSLGALGCAIGIAIAGFAFGRQWKQQAELGLQEERAAALRTAMKVAEAAALQVAHSAEHDFLTGLPNRMLLNDRVSQAIALAALSRKRGLVGHAVG